MGITLRQGATGAILEGENDGDTLRWNATTASWDAGEPGTTLPDGEYAGQPLTWDGASEWVPNNSVVVDAIASNPLSQLTIAAGENGLQVSTGGVSSAIIQGGGGAQNLTLAETQANLAVSALARLVLTVNGSPVFDANDAGAGGIAFLGKVGCVGVQSITGATEQEQINSLVAALVAFGLASDDR